MSQSPPFIPDDDKAKIRQRHLTEIETLAYVGGMLNTFRRESVLMEEALEGLSTLLEKAGIKPYSPKFEYVYKTIENARCNAKGLSLELLFAIDEAKKAREGGAA